MKIQETDDDDDDEAAPTIQSSPWMPSASTNFDSSKYDFAGNRPPQLFLPGGADPMTYFKYLLTDQESREWRNDFFPCASSMEDQVGHFPTYARDRFLCAIPECTLRSYIRWSKCNMVSA